jgi:CHAT domain-containing protein
MNRQEKCKQLFDSAIKFNRLNNFIVNEYEYSRSIAYATMNVLNYQSGNEKLIDLIYAKNILTKSIPNWESFYKKQFEFSKIGFDDQYFINPYQKLVYIYSELFRLTGNKFYFMKCFQFIEKTKNSTNYKNENRLIDGYAGTNLSIQKVKAICKQTNSALINFFKTEAPNVTRALLILPDTALQCLISDQNQLHLDHELTEFNKKILTNNFKKFKTNFYELYKLCFKSIDSTLIKNKISKITVIPDVSMGFLNFDLLQTDSLLPFNKSALINKYKITYNINITSFINNYNNNIGYNEIKLHVPNYEKTNYPVLSFSDRFKDKLNELFRVTYVDIKKFKTDFFTQNSLHHYIGHINSNAYSNEQTLFLESTNFESTELYNKNVKGSTYILSGCGSNVGRTYLYNKVNSMPYNLLSHEASAVISANWQIDDEANADFLNAFYNYLKKGEKSSEAFYKTKLDFIKLNKPPAVWGAYFYFGNDFEIGSNNKGLLIFLIVVIVSILLIVFKVRFRK